MIELLVLGIIMIFGGMFIGIHYSYRIPSHSYETYVLIIGFTGIGVVFLGLAMRLIFG